jgi:Xaa-Pro aminopeptidase
VAYPTPRGRTSISRGWWIFFFQNVDAIVGPEDPVVYRERLTREFDYELELAVGELAERMVPAIERAYWAGGGGLRVEDTFLVTADRAEKVCGWPHDFKAEVARPLAAEARP